MQRYSHQHPQPQAPASGATLRRGKVRDNGSQRICDPLLPNEFRLLSIDRLLPFDLLSEQRPGAKWAVSWPGAPS